MRKRSSLPKGYVLKLNDEHKQPVWFATAAFVRDNLEADSCYHEASQITKGWYWRFANDEDSEWEGPFPNQERALRNVYAFVSEAAP